MRAFYMKTSAHEVGWIILYPSYTNVTQQEEFRSDTSAVVGSTPTISTKLAWTAGAPEITTRWGGLANLVNITKVSTKI